MLALSVFSAGAGLVGIGVAVSGLLSTILITIGITTALVSVVLFFKKPSPAPPRERTGVKTKGGKLRMTRSRIRGQDRGIDSEDTDVDVDKSDIE